MLGKIRGKKQSETERSQEAGDHLEAGNIYHVEGKDKEAGKGK